MKFADGIQTNYPALESFVDMKTMMKGLEKTISWSDVGILFDKQNKSTLILLLDPLLVKSSP